MRARAVYRDNNYDVPGPEVRDFMADIDAIDRPLTIEEIKLIAWRALDIGYRQGAWEEGGIRSSESPFILEDTSTIVVHEGQRSLDNRTEN